MRTVKLYPALASLMLAGVLGLVALPTVAHDKQANAAGQSGRVPVPVHHINTDKGDQCVRPVDVMRRDHMKFILHQRDRTVHEGIRTPQYSLKNCVDCHADTKTGSVLGKDGFCESCHQYAAVKIDCFECHSAQREAAATPEKAPAGAPVSSVRGLNVAQKPRTASTKDKHP